MAAERRHNFQALCILLAACGSATALDLDDMSHHASNAWKSASDAIGTASTMLDPKEQLTSLANGFLELLVTFLQPLSNVLYVFIMLYGFAKLPVNFMLVAGIVTAFIGPYFVAILIKLLMAIVSMGASYPIVVGLFAWLAVFMQSALFQQFAIAVGLDRNQDGSVNFHDVLGWLAETRVGRALQLHDVYVALTRIPPQATIGNRPIIERLERIEAALGGNKLPAPARLPAPQPTQAPSATAGPAVSCGGFKMPAAWPGLPSWASPANAAEFAAKQRASKQGAKPGTATGKSSDLV